MRQAYKVWGGLAAGVFCLVAITDLAGGATSAPVAATSVSSSVTAPAAGDPAALPTVSPAVGAGGDAGRAGRVTEIIDGDTFVIDGERVRVLGIDSCEADTTGGALATADAVAMLDGQQVVLRAEPGVDRDRYDRLLRYVEVAGLDYGDAMVGRSHTGVYGGDNDASPQYVARLRADDADGRACGGSTTTSSSATPTPDPDVDRPYVPIPDLPSSSSSSGGGSSGGAAAYYENCSAARAAGAAPLHRGDPGYSGKLDRDDDGVACE